MEDLACSEMYRNWTFNLSEASSATDPGYRVLSLSGVAYKVRG